MTSNRPLAAVLVAVSFLFLASCGAGQEEPQGSPHPTEFLPTEDRPYTVEITYPADDAAIEGTDVLVAVAVRGFSVVDKLGEKSKKGEGHVHYYLDVDRIPTTPNEPAVTDDDRTYHATAATTHTWKDVEPGRHTLGAQLVNNDHTPLDPPVTDEVEITVSEAGAPTAAPQDTSDPGRLPPPGG